MKIHREMIQGGWEWLTSRAGKITGSELGNLITDKGAIRDWKTAMPNSYLCLKLAETWRGTPLESFGGNRQTDQGTLHEDEARKFFGALLDADIETIGGFESDDGKLWCSPDGIIGETQGLEIKCPNANTHVKWLLAGGVPEEHVLQCQFALYVSGWHTWQFLAYCKDMPHLAVPVEPDGELHDTISEAVYEFKLKFDAAWVRLCDMNGGPPPKREPPKEPIKFTWEQQDDVIP